MTDGFTCSGFRLVNESSMVVALASINEFERVEAIWAKRAIPCNNSQHVQW